MEVWLGGYDKTGGINVKRHHVWFFFNAGNMKKYQDFSTEGVPEGKRKV